MFMELLCSRYRGLKELVDGEVQECKRVDKEVLYSSATCPVGLCCFTREIYYYEEEKSSFKQ